MAITKYDDIIDSGDVRNRIEELTDAESLDDGETEELAALRDLWIELECVSTEAVQYGDVLVRDSYFVDFAQQLAEDTGAVNDNAQWPYTCIDWGEAARELQYDYSSVDFDGETYWVHS